MARPTNTLSPGPEVWVVLHCEVFLEARNYQVDEMVVFVASSKQSLEQYFKRVSIRVGTWWRVERGRLNDLEGTMTRSVLYSRMGKVIKRPPVKQGYRAAIAENRKWAERYLEKLKNARRDGRPKKELAKLERILRDFRWRLRGHPQERFILR